MSNRNNNATAQHRTKYGSIRFIVLSGAFLVILLNPFVNFYLHNNFVQGWYQSLGIGNLWFVSPLEGLESILISRQLYMPSIIGMLIPFLLAYMIGRVFCSWICPVTFFLEISDRLRKKISGRKLLQNRLIVAKRVLWFVLIGELLASLILGTPVFVFLSPPGLIGREIMMFVFFGNLAFEGILLLAILGLEVLTRRFFCRTFCPLGGLLAFIGHKRKLHVKLYPENCTQCGLCQRSCPMGLSPCNFETTTPYCWNCGECVDICKFDALHFTWSNKVSRYQTVTPADTNRYHPVTKPSPAETNLLKVRH